jgi:hypothetical protein
MATLGKDAVVCGKMSGFTRIVLGVVASKNATPTTTVSLVPPADASGTSDTFTTAYGYLVTPSNTAQVGGTSFATTGTGTYNLFVRVVSGTVMSTATCYLMYTGVAVSYLPGVAIATDLTPP